jgi:steroid 5-alpha reductase family enzyme
VIFIAIGERDMLDTALTILGMLGVSLAIVMGLMFLLWIVYLIKKNVNVVDIGWGVSFILTVLVYFALGDGYFWRRLLILILVSIWSLRLVTYLMERFSFQKEPRYQQILQSTARHINLKVLALFLLQGFLVVVLSLPFALMSQNVLPFFTAPEVFGLLLWMGGVLGETVADDQLYRFKQNPNHENQVYEGGLWRYCRHPNYFFEWVIWIAYFIIALSSPLGWLAVISPILMLYLLLKVSGVPLAEAEALQTKGDAYKNYQKRTSVFFPWFKFR